MRLLFDARGVRTELELAPGTWTVGGGVDDGVRFPGLPPGVVELELSPERAWIRCRVCRPVGRAILEPGTRRWLLPGERVQLSGKAWLQVDRSTPELGTRALVRSLLEPGSAEASSAAALICVVGEDAGSIFPLLGSAPELGRLPGCLVRLRDRCVSRRHLRLLRARGVHRVEDLGGRNRARCNGRWLRSGLLLSDGDLIEVGRSLLHYRAEAAEPGGVDVDRGEAAEGAPAGGLTSSGKGRPVPPAAP